MAVGRHSGIRVVAILPLVTLGLGACLPSIWRAARNGFPKFYALAVAYGVASLVCLVVSTIPGWDNTVTTIGAGGLVLLAVTSSCQALALVPSLAVADRRNNGIR